jgi:vancomycin resistance protein VanW
MQGWLKQSLRRIPLVTPLRIRQLQWGRSIADWRQGIRFAGKIDSPSFSHRILKHKSLIFRPLAGTDPQLQHNKAVNLSISIKKIDGVVIRPRETFSLWKLVGRPTARKGYLEGLTISGGQVGSGTGGGLCQLANLIFWLGLHTPLEVAERHHHSFDLFPDNQRTLPFGSGTTIFYNYLDLRFYNPTDLEFQIRLWLSEKFLEGDIKSSRPMEREYRIEERNHRFEQEGQVWYRKNEIWRLVLDPGTQTVLEERLLIRNRSEVRYKLQQAEEAEAAVRN